MSGWAARKAAVAAEARAIEAAEAQARDAALAERPEAEVLAELDLPAPESLGMGDDFTRFLRDGVPGWLRQRALRRLWRVNPVLANVDGLVDYGGDFTDAATVVPNMATTYEVGRGMARHIMALAEQAAAEEAGETADDAPAEDPMIEETPTIDTHDQTYAEAEIEPAPAVSGAPARRRMRFDFEDEA